MEARSCRRATARVRRARQSESGRHSFGTGSSTLYLTAELLKSMAALDMVGVAYKGVAEASTDVMAGRVSITVNTVGARQADLGPDA